MQVFLDILEQVNVLMNSKGTVLRCDVNGKMTMKAFLTGMPEIKVGLNDMLEVSPCSSETDRRSQHRHPLATPGLGHHAGRHLVAGR